MIDTDKTPSDNPEITTPRITPLLNIRLALSGVIVILIVILFLPINGKTIWQTISPLVTQEEEITCSDGLVKTRMLTLKKQYKDLSPQELNLNEHYNFNWECVEPNQPQPTVIYPVDKLLCNCSQESNPVCGADYKTYLNSCVAACRQVAISYRGECRIYLKSVLPEECIPCDLVCNDNEYIYEDANGCPHCTCLTDSRSQE